MYFENKRIGAIGREVWNCGTCGILSLWQKNYILAARPSVSWCLNRPLVNKLGIWNEKSGRCSLRGPGGELS